MTWLPLLPTIRERIRREFQQQAEGLGAVLAALFTPLAPSLVSRGVADVVDRQLSSYFAYLPGTIGLASVSGPDGPVAASCFKTISFRHSYCPATLQFPPSESANCASKPPKSCLVGGIVNCTPLAIMSSWYF